MAIADDSSSTDPSLLRMLSGPLAHTVWEKFFQRYQPHILNACYQSGLTHHDAQEIASRVLAKLLRVFPNFRYDPAFSFRGWLKTVIRNETADYWRELQRRPGAVGQGGDNDCLAELPDPLQQLAVELDGKLSDDLERAGRIVERVRRRVDETTWLSYWLTAIEGAAAQAAADKLKISVASVYVNKGRVKRMLAEEGAQNLADDMEPGA